MVYIAAYGPARPEEQAEMRRPDVDLETVGVWVRRAAPELTSGRRVVGDTKSEAGKRFIVLPGFMRRVTPATRSRPNPGRRRPWSDRRMSPPGSMPWCVPTASRAARSLLVRIWCKMLSAV